MAGSGSEKGFRWTSPHATARVYRPPQATVFEVVTTISAEHLAAQGSTDLTVRLNGVPLPSVTLRELDVRTVRWTVPPAPAGPVEVELQAEPPFHAPGDPRTLGAAILSFGFLPAKEN